MATIRRSRATGTKRWEWSVRLQKYPIRYGTCPTKACAKECAEEAERQLKAGVEVSRITVRELVELFEATYLPQIPRSAQKHRQHLGISARVATRRASTWLRSGTCQSSLY